MLMDKLIDYRGGFSILVGFEGSEDLIVSREWAQWLKLPKHFTHSHQQHWHWNSY